MDFLKRFQSIFNFFNQSVQIPKIKSVAEAFFADKQKMAGDWKKVGGDRYQVMKESIGEEAFERLTKGLDEQNYKNEKKSF